MGASVQPIWRPEFFKSFNPAAHDGNPRLELRWRLWQERRRWLSSPSLSPSRSYLSPSRSFFRRCRRKARFFPRPRPVFPRAPIRPRGSAQGVCRARLPDARTPNAQSVRFPRYSGHHRRRWLSNGDTPEIFFAWTPRRRIKNLGCSTSP